LATINPESDKISDGSDAPRMGTIIYKYWVSFGDSHCSFQAQRWEAGNIGSGEFRKYTVLHVLIFK